MSRTAILLFGVGGVVVAGCIALALTYRPPIKSIARPNPRSFSTAEVQRGAVLAAIGDCDVCHTAEGAAPYAGGKPLPTPFGTLYSTNITPDESTGIGNWSRDAFRRAMRDGVGRGGSHLYPALPYENYTHVNDADLDAIYAFLMTRPAVPFHAPRNEMIFPLGFRPFLAGWKLLFLQKGAFAPNPRKSEQWNRGAYLVEGLGHCGACHTPRNIAGGEKRAHQYQGGVAEGWNCPPLDSSNPATVAWTESTLYEYLRTGMNSSHGVAGGTMGPVTDNLAKVPDTDVRAIVVYVASLMHDSSRRSMAAQGPIDDEQRGHREHPEGSALFAGACAGCHERGAPMMMAGRPTLSSVSAIQEEDPRNTVQVILQGLNPPLGNRGPYMPPFANSFTDPQISELAAYLRSRYSHRTAWPALAQSVAKIRQE